MNIGSLARRASAIQRYFSTNRPKSIRRRSNKYLIATTMGIALSAVSFIMLGSKAKLPETTLTKDKLQMLDNQLTVKSGDEPFENNNLRAKFNFIDQVAKQCMDAVVFIEILDPKKIDPLTNEPVVLSNGSGFIFREEGWILTNAHVVISKPQAMIYVKLPDGSSYKATIEDADLNMDLAILKINANRIFRVLKLGNSVDVNIGEWVLALGSPLSLSHSVTAGVVSSTAREAEDLGLRNHSMRYIQTDASITFGNSGGPLVNLDGSVIGINNLRITAGISFAIPIDYAKKFVNRSMTNIQKISDNSQSRDLFLGIATITLSKAIVGEILSESKTVPKDLKQGVLVYKVIDGTIADKSGLLAGDIVTHINEMPVLAATDIYASYNAADRQEREFTVDVLRRGQKKKIKLKS